MKESAPRLVVRLTDEEKQRIKVHCAEVGMSEQDAGYQLVMEWLDGKRKLTKQLELGGELRRKIVSFRHTLEELIEAIDDITRRRDPEPEETRGEVPPTGGHAPRKVGGTGESVAPVPGRTRR